MAEIASVTQRGKFEPFELQAARGQIAWHNIVHVWGYNSDIDQSEETVWPDGGVASVPSVASVLKVSSSSTNDAAAGTGAQTVVIRGLDSSHNEISETVTLNGQTAVNTVKQYLHINYIYVATVGSGGKNAGKLYVGDGIVTAGVPATIYGIVDVGFNASTTAFYTIPAGYTAYMYQGSISSGQAGGTAQITGYLVLRGQDNVSRVAAVATLNNGQANFNFYLPIKIDEKTSIEARGIGSSNNNAVAANFQLLLVKNDGA
jgi:hypothetical protein